MTNATRSLIIRALNYWRHYHLETYAGIRYIADASAISGDSDWLNDFIARKSVTTGARRTLSFPRLKERTSTGEFIYRPFVAQSPVGALIEARLLQDLSGINGFLNSPNVYSYRWPTRSADRRIFDYYWHGYSERTIGIAEASRESSNSVVVIADVKGFYPNLNRDLIALQLNKVFEQVNHVGENAALLDHLQSSIRLSPGDRGLPIGPPTSHVLANLAMKDIDEILARKYGGKYFRYVDDIAIVCEKEKASEVLQELQSLLDHIGLKLNDSKTDIVSGTTWLTRVENRPEDGPESLDNLITQATLACALFPDRLGAFRQVCRDLNILFPDKRLEDRSRSNRYRRWLYVLLQNGVHSVTSAAKLDAAVFSSRLIAIRRNLELRAAEIFAAPLAASSMARKWQLQDQRYLLNRLFYLTPLDSLGDLLRYVSNAPEHMEFRALVNACINSDPAGLLQYPGPIVATFCSVADKIGLVSISNNRLNKPSAATSAALSNLFISGALDPRSVVVDSASPEDARLLQFSSFRSTPIRDDWEIDYMDELHSLQTGFNRSSTQDLLLSRFDWQEDVMLEALTIGGDGYYAM